MAETSITGVVYLHFCRPSGKCYVGKTVYGMSKRWCDHVKTTRWPKHVAYGYPFARAIRKYGKNAFEHQILAVAPEEQLANLERVWIILLNSRIPNGYNITPGGEGHRVRHSEETKHKISQNRRGKSLGNRNAAGQDWSLERRKNLSRCLRRKNKPRSHVEAQRRLMSQRWSNPEFREKMRQKSLNLWEDRRNGKKPFPHFNLLGLVNGRKYWPRKKNS